MAHLTKIEISTSIWDKFKSDLVVVGVYDDKTLTPIAKSINEYNKNLFDEAIKMGDIKGKKREMHLFYIENRRVLLLGLGSKEKFDTNEARLVAGSASRFAIDKKIDKMLDGLNYLSNSVLEVSDSVTPISNMNAANTLLANNIQKMISLSQKNIIDNLKNKKK